MSVSVIEDDDGAMIVKIEHPRFLPGPPSRCWQRITSEQATALAAALLGMGSEELRDRLADAMRVREGS